MPDPISWEFAWPYLATALAFGYLLGSIPFGLILTRLAGTADLKSIGSGNIGATNVLRTGRKDLAALTLALDALKGAAAVLLAAEYGIDASVCAALGAILGHMFPVWLKFRGGKGVATYLGTLAGLFWPSALIFAGIWFAVAAITRFSSLAAIIAAIAIPVSLHLFEAWQLRELYFLLSLVLIAAHHTNIRRLASGTESRIGGDAQ